MSLERLKVKKSKYSDTYSKNPILNSLIKQKLEGEIQNIRESTIKVIEKNQQKITEKPQSQMNNKRMKSLSSLTMNRVKESLNFDPLMTNLIKDRQAVLFVQSRQLQTPLIESEKLRSVIEARARPEQLQIKMSARDRYSYEKILNAKKLQQVSKQIKESIRGISSQLWIPDQPEIEEMFKDPMAQDDYLNRVEKDLKSLRQKSHMLDVNLNCPTGNQKLGKSSSHILNWGIENQKQRLKPLKVIGYQGPSFQINYNVKRYHKNDYINLEQFLSASLASQILTQAMNPSEHLEKSYAIYMSTWKQLVRLTYIQNWQKGLLMEKIMWSFIRVIRNIIQTQHSVNYQQFKDQARLLRQTQKMYEERMQKLDEALKQEAAQLKSIKSQQKKLLMTIVTFEKVNRQLGQDLDNKTRELDRKKEQLNYIQHKYHSLLNQLVQNDLIHNDQRKLYIVNKYHQPQMLMNMIDKGPERLSGQQIYIQQQQKKGRKEKNSKSPSKGRYADLPQSVKLSFPNVQKAQSQQQYEYTRYGKKIRKLQNQLNKYWQKKQDDLQLRAVLQSITNIRVNDMCVQTNHREKISIQVATQVGQQQEQQNFDFEKYLNDKIQQERQYWKLKTDQSNNLYISLQQLYEDNNKKIQQITATSNQQAEQLKSLRKKITELNQNLNTKTAQNYTLHDQLKQQNKNFTNRTNELNLKILSLEDQINNLQAAKTDLDKKLKMQKDNNDLLVRKNLEYDMKVKKMEKQKNIIMEKITAVTPWLQKFMESVDGLQEGPLFNLYSDVSKKIQQHLGQYVQKDANVFNLTK